MADRRNATTTRAGVLRPEEFARHVALDRAACATALSHWVENYWSVQWDLPAGTSYVSSTLPHPACTLSIERGETRPGVEEPVVVTGVPTRRFDVTARGRSWTFGVKFRPGGMAALSGLPARRLRDRTVPAGEVFPAAVVARLAALTEPAACPAGVDAALTALDPPPDPAYDDLLELVQRMLADRSLVRVAQLEELAGVGPRTLQRLFGHYVGVGPKWVLARYRMHDVVSELDAGSEQPLADLAATYGWYDQAHFTREFTALVGVPPAGYRAR